MYCLFARASLDKRINLNYSKQGDFSHPSVSRRCCRCTRTFSGAKIVHTFGFRWTLTATSTIYVRFLAYVVTSRTNTLGSFIMGRLSGIKYSTITLTVAYTDMPLEKPAEANPVSNYHTVQLRIQASQTLPRPSM